MHKIADNSCSEKEQREGTGLSECLCGYRFKCCQNIAKCFTLIKIITICLFSRNHSPFSSTELKKVVCLCNIVVLCKINYLGATQHIYFISIYLKTYTFVSGSIFCESLKINRTYCDMVHI